MAARMPRARCLGVEEKPHVGEAVFRAPEHGRDRPYVVHGAVEVLDKGARLRRRGASDTGARLPGGNGRRHLGAPPVQLCLRRLVLVDADDERAFRLRGDVAPGAGDQDEHRGGHCRLPGNRHRFHGIWVGSSGSIIHGR